MKIIVAVKPVAARDSAIHIESPGKWLEEQDLSFEIDEPDAYALETALLLKKRAGTTIREALAKGGGRTAHIQSDDFVKLDTFAAAVRKVKGA